MLCRYACQSVSVQRWSKELAQAGFQGISNAAISDAITFLTDSLLVCAVPSFEGLGTSKPSAAKYCLFDHLVREAWLQERLPLDVEGLAEAHESVMTQVGHLAESVVGSYFSSVPRLELSWFPGTANEAEVDFVITCGLKRIPVEVKYRHRVQESDLTAIRDFIGRPKYSAPFGLVITQQQIGEEDGLFLIPLFLLLGLR